MAASSADARRSSSSSEVRPEVPPILPLATQHEGGLVSFRVPTGLRAVTTRLTAHR